MLEFLQHFWRLFCEAAPWLTLGLLLSGVIKAWLPTDQVKKHLGQPGVKPVLKAALIGMPLPLCSCGVIPVAVGVRRAGASKGATLSFLISTPETGVDSIAVSYALLGPIMAVVRPLAALFTAVSCGLMAGWNDVVDRRDVDEGGACCGTVAQAKPAGIREGIAYAFNNMVDDIAPWMFAGLLFAAAVSAFVPPDVLLEWGSGLPAMFLIIALSIPMYVCASASTPIGVGLLLAGISPGTVLVFLLAGPATNVATLGLVHKELGRRALGVYLAGIGGISIAMGLALDYGWQRFGIDITGQMEGAWMLMPAWLGPPAALLLTLLAIKPLRRGLIARAAH